ncbi:MAG: crosslink repair DNA glycosylase YcaQ family protein, partial [Candidatus Latescibacteria bacterium]|nr:crosslink repair DNA glycosylase YcaQ family protein [Candidatus Latescibacterota bacterium]
PFYALTDYLNGSLRGRKPQVHILSPFDNLTIRRQWLKALFDFDYRLECYLPSAKRAYGYFCLPVLWGTEFVGRLDAKADRKNRTFIVRNFAFESAVKKDDALLLALADRLCAFATFNGCDQVVIEKTVPSKMKVPLKKVLELR